MQCVTPASKPLAGSSSPTGASSLISLPSAPTKVSFSGLNVRSPAIAKAVTSSGEVTKACVAGLPSLRAAKLRLYDVTMELASPVHQHMLSTLCNRHTVTGNVAVTNWAYPSSLLSSSTVQCKVRKHLPAQCLQPW
jgi:hypothetical protein